MRSTRVEKVALDITAENFAAEPSLNDIRPTTSSSAVRGSFKITPSKSARGRSPLFKEGSGIDPRSKTRGIMPPKRRHSLQLMKESLGSSGKHGPSVSQPASPSYLQSFTPPGAKSQPASPQKRLSPFFAGKKSFRKEATGPAAEMIQVASETPQKKTATLVAYAFDSPKEGSNAQAVVAAENLLDRWKVLGVSFSRLQSPPTPQSLAMKMKHQALQFQHFKAIFSALYDRHPSATTPSRLLSGSEEDTYDDPTMVCNEILSWASTKGFGGELKLADLKKGYGNETVIPVLSWMSDSLEADINPLIRRPEVSEKDATNHESASVFSSSSASEASSIADDCALETNFEDDDQAVYEPVMERSFVMITPATDPVEWRMELERISAKLRPLKQSAIGSDWRAHVKASIESTAMLSSDEAASNALAGISSLLARDLESVRSKEGALMAIPNVKEVSRAFRIQSRLPSSPNLSVQLNTRQLSGDFATLKRALDEIREQHNNSSSQFEATLASLEDIEEDIKGVKTETNQRTNYMSDSSVLTHIRAGIGRLKAEAVELNLRLGTAENLIAAKISCEERRNLVGNDSSDDDGDD